MGFHVTIGSQPSDVAPLPEKYARFFQDDVIDQWEEGGAVFVWVCDDADTQTLTVFVNPNYGFWMQYEDDSKPSDLFFSVGDKGRMNEYVEAETDDTFTIRGLYVGAEIAWLAAEDFLLNKGARSRRVIWIAEEELPPGMEWLVAKDCLE